MIRRIVWARKAHNLQRYDTIGDWEHEPTSGALTVTTSILPDFRSELAVAIHEIVEALACTSVGVLAQEVDAFDMGEEGSKLADPGSSPAAPYHSQHMLALEIEKLACRLLQLEWQDHEFNCENPLPSTPATLLASGQVLSVELP
jgi:hypothetical protein